MSATLTAIINVVIYLAIIPGLWLAGIMQPSVTGWLKHTRFSGIFSRPVVRFILWLALGYFFTLPLIDLLYWLESWIGLFTTQGQALTFSGVLLSSYFLGIVMLGVVYGIILSITRSFWKPGGQSINVGRLFATGGVSSLVADIVRGATLPFSFLQSVMGVTGFFVGWFLALVVLVLIIALMNSEFQHFWNNKD